jgi:hypothetical protein
MGYLQNTFTKGKAVVYQIDIHLFIFMYSSQLLLSGRFFYSIFDTGLIHWIGIIAFTLGLYSLIERFLACL